MSNQTPDQITARYQDLFGSLNPASDDNDNSIPDGLEAVFEENEDDIMESFRLLDQTDPPKTPAPPTSPPGTGPTVDSIRDSLLTPSKQRIKDDFPRRQAREYSGINNTKILEPNPTYYATEAEDVISGKHNTFIIQGRDRPRDIASGAGGMCRSHAGCIDIIAGLSGPFAREEGANGESVMTNKSPELDSARIYISQNAVNIDGREYFNLAKGKIGYRENASAIAIKADSVRLIGREGIKLVTSGDNFNGLGQFVGGATYGVDIIAGNNDADLQPMVKGDNLVKVLDNLVEMMSDVQGSTAFLYEMLVTVMACFIDPSGTSMMKLNDVLNRLPIEVGNLSRQDVNFVKHKLNYESIFGAWNFRSKFNNVN